MLWPGLTILGALFVVASFIPPHGYDLIAYWQVDPAHPYTVTEGLSGQGVFRYAPPVALLFAPLELLSWPVVCAVWLVLQLGALYLVCGRWALAAVVYPPVWLDLVYGNVNVMLAAAIVAGAWAFPLLTKVTPGISLAWYVGRRDWRMLAVTATTTAAIVGASLVIQGPAVWSEWFATLTASVGQPLPFDALHVPLLPRLIAAGALALWGGWTARRWTLPVAFVLAMPVLWVIAFAPLVALARRPS